MVFTLPRRKCFSPVAGIQIFASIQRDIINSFPEKFQSRCRDSDIREPVPTPLSFVLRGFSPVAGIQIFASG